MKLHIFAHIERYHGVFTAEKRLGCRLCQLCFTYACRADKRNEPTGRFGSPSPALPRLIARETETTALSCPITRRARISSSRASRSPSSSLMRETGICVHAVTVSAISFSPMTALPDALAHSHFHIPPRAHRVQQLSHRARLPPLRNSESARALLFYSQCSKSALQRPYLLRLAALLYPFFAAASSMRSIALSGRNLSPRYLTESLTAASIASSVIFTR